MIERPYMKDGKDNGHLVMTEATVRVEAPRGRRKCPTAVVEGGSIAAALLSSIGDRCTRAFNYPDSLFGDVIRGWEVDHITPISRGGSDD